MVKKTNPYKSLPDSEHITGQAKIIRLLKRFTERYIPLTAQIPGHKTQYTSCIVNVDKSSLLLDELLPHTGHERLSTEGALLVSGKIDGIDIQFFTTLKRVDEKEKIITYTMELPERVDYQQRRQAYRARIPIAVKLPVYIENKNSQWVEGELRDLSHGGAGIIFLTSQSIMEPGMHHNCTIMLTDGRKINCIAELRFSKHLSAQDRQFYGIQFIGLDKMQSRLIASCINELERELIRKRANL